MRNIPGYLLPGPRGDVFLCELMVSYGLGGLRPVVGIVAALCLVKNIVFHRFMALCQNNQEKSKLNVRIGFKTLFGMCQKMRFWILF